MTGYDAKIVMAFIDAHREGWELNGQRVYQAQREMLEERWRKWKVIELRKVDAFLTRFGLMLFELEQWAEEHYGWDGYVDPLKEPKELVG